VIETKKLKLVFWHCAFPMLLGLLLYAFFHKPDLLLHKWIYKYCQTPSFFSSINKSSITIFLLNHVPDLLWAYSLTFSFLLFISNALPAIVKAAFIIIVVSFTEIIQLFFPEQFTFDWVDLFLSIITVVVILIFWPHEKENNF
jgi:hypothetical protein